MCKFCSRWSNAIEKRGQQLHGTLSIGESPRILAETMKVFSVSGYTGSCIFSPFCLISSPSEEPSKNYVHYWLISPETR
uniref:Uncharacterized protein n=1 Tax=Ditylenchus dipsaci TaxID=166011 RepID=A0A915CVK2_9BILA